MCCPYALRARAINSKVGIGMLVPICGLTSLCVIETDIIITLWCPCHVTASINPTTEASVSFGVQVVAFPFPSKSHYSPSPQHSAELPPLTARLNRPEGRTLHLHTSSLIDRLTTSSMLPCFHCLQYHVQSLPV